MIHLSARSAKLTDRRPADNSVMTIRTRKLNTRAEAESGAAVWVERFVRQNGLLVG